VCSTTHLLTKLINNILLTIISGPLEPAFRKAKNSPRLPKRSIRWLILLQVIVLPLQSCGSVSIEACDRIKTSVYKPPIEVQEVAFPQDIAAATYDSKQQAVLAEQLARIPIEDKLLNEYRANLVALYRHDSDLGLQVSAFMNPNGIVVVNSASRIAYEQVASQRIVINEQVSDQLEAIDSYCASKQKPSQERLSQEKASK
jgi:hypothetical protein